MKFHRENKILFQDNLHSLLTWFMSYRSRILDDGNYTYLIADMVSSGYSNLFFPSDVEHKKVIRIPTIEEKKYKKDPYLKPVIDLKKFALVKLRPFIKYFFIHGSIATMDYIKGWSDFDIYVVIKSCIVYDPDKLIELRKLLLEAHKFLYKIDPLQHHGFLMCTELDLRNYLSNFLPTAVLKFAKSLFRPVRLVVKEVITKEIAIKKLYEIAKVFYEAKKTGVFKRHAYKGEYLLSKYRNWRNGLYQFKNYLGYVTIVPAYFMESIGKPCYKRDAIERIREILSPASKELIDDITKLRYMWNEKTGINFKKNRIPKWVINTFPKNYFERGAKFMSEIISYIRKL